MKDQALLIIDVQRGLFHGPLVPHDAENILDRINGLSSQARVAGVPIIFVQHDGTVKDGLEPGSSDWQLHPELEREDSDRVIRKTACDSFYGTLLLETLKRLSAREIIICGYATEFCIETTVRRAASEKFDVILASDAHTTKDRPILSAKEIITHHNWVLANLIQPDNPIRVLTSNQIKF
jgi:nicotinamidase-related amidase